jgi:prepilin-type N-terminal cleavage/methylation domain-containing protein
MPLAPRIAPARTSTARRFWPNQQPSAGFTLVEILTATAIMALLVSLVMVILTQVMSAWNRSTDDMTFSTNARLVFESMTQDFQGCILRSDGNQWLSLTTDAPPKGSAVPSATDSRLIFFTSTPLHQTKDASTPGAPGKTIAGDICAVEYRVVYADPFGANSPPGSTTSTKTFSLHRVVLDPVSTFYGINGVPVMGLNTDTTPTSLVASFDSSVDLQSAATTPTQNRTPTVAIPYGGSNGPSPLTIPIYGAYATASMLLDNVAQFTVFLYFNGQDPSQSLPIQAYPQTAINKSNPPALFYGGSTKPTADAGYFDGKVNANAPPVFLSLAYADVTLTILTDDGINYLQQGNGAVPQGLTWQQFIQKFGKTYTQRIPVLITPH